LKSYYVRADADKKLYQYVLRIRIDCGRSHVNAIFNHLRVFLRNINSMCLLSLPFQKNKSENVVEYGSRQRSGLIKPNALKVKSQGWCGNSRYL